MEWTANYTEATRTNLWDTVAQSQAAVGRWETCGEAEIIRKILWNDPWKVKAGAEDVIFCPPNRTDRKLEYKTLEISWNVRKNKRKTWYVNTY